MMQQLTDWLIFFERTFPSANSALILGPEPVLFDSGFGSDFPATEALLQDAGVSPADLSLVINSHYHSDHVGGNHGLQTRYGVPVAAYYTEGRLINQRDVVACSAEWLVQTIQPYTVDRLLEAGTEIHTGQVALKVVHSPGHTLGHISLYQPDDQIIILGDVVHANDVAWVNNFREGAGALERIMETLDHLLTMPIRLAISGHGPVHRDPKAVIESALRRYERWQQSPESVAWHAMKRIFAYALMLEDGMSRERVETYLLTSPWFRDFTTIYFQTTPAEFIEDLLQEMTRSGAARWHDNHLMATTAYHAPPPDWYPEPQLPRNWPK